jgi:D-hexose-6-phosphate mutarotase
MSFSFLQHTHTRTHERERILPTHNKARQQPFELIEMKQEEHKAAASFILSSSSSKYKKGFSCDKKLTSRIDVI